MNDNVTFNKVKKSTCRHHDHFSEAKLPANLIRHRCVSVRLNDDELSLLDDKRGEFNRAEWLRMASLHKLPTVVPSINIEAWKALGEISQKLNKLVFHLDNKSHGSLLTQTELFAVKRQISELRLNLITTDLWSKPCEGNAKNPQG